MTLSLFLVAGEPSGDRLGADLMRALRAETGGAVGFAGVGGPLMAAEGLRSLFPIADIAVMGVFEILPRIRTIARRIRETADAALAAGADAMVTIDVPGFSLRVAPRVKAARPDLPVIHYVAPSVWAWRPGRARMMAPHVDHVLALFPFEPPYMTAAGMGCDFVGHPIAAVPVPDAAARAAIRAELGAGGPLLTVLPGSRRGEVARLAPVFAAALRQVATAVPRVTVAVPAALSVAGQVAEAVRGWDMPVRLLDPRGMSPEAAEARKFACFAASDAALAASGTVTLELAAMGCPMVSAYRMNHLTSLLVRRLIRVPSANLVNILAGRKAVPEFLQEYCTPGALAGALLPLLVGGPEREAQLAAEDEALEMVGRGGAPPPVRAARAVLAAVARGARGPRR